MLMMLSIVVILVLIIVVVEATLNDDEYKKMTFEKLFNKDWKFYIRHDSLIGNFYGVLLNRLGIWFLRLARFLLSKGGGSFRRKHYMNCSWCGDEQTSKTGLHMSVGMRGARCCKVSPTCDKRYKNIKGGL